MSPVSTMRTLPQPVGKVVSSGSTSCAETAETRTTSARARIAKAFMVEKQCRTGASLLVALSARASESDWRRAGRAMRYRKQEVGVSVTANAIMKSGRQSRTDLSCISVVNPRFELTLYPAYEIPARPYRASCPRASCLLRGSLCCSHLSIPISVMQHDSAARRQGAKNPMEVCDRGFSCTSSYINLAMSTTKGPQLVTGLTQRMLNRVELNSSIPCDDVGPGNERIYPVCSLMFRIRSTSLSSRRLPPHDHVASPPSQRMPWIAQPARPQGPSAHDQLLQRRGAEGARLLARRRGHVQCGALPGFATGGADERIHALWQQLLPVLRACMQGAI